MADDVASLTAQLTRLRDARATGTRRMVIADQETEFRSDAEFATAIADLERRLAIAQGHRPVRITYFRTSKGL